MTNQEPLNDHLAGSNGPCQVGRDPGPRPGTGVPLRLAACPHQYDPSLRDPNIQVTSADLAGDRRLVLTHQMHNDVPLAERDAKAVLGHIADLWGFDVELRGVGAEPEPRYSYEMALADQGLAALK